MEDVTIVQEAPGTEPQAVVLPNPISTEPMQQDPGAGDKPEATAPKPAPEKKLSVRDSLEAAAKKTELDAAAAEKAKPLGANAPTARDATGKFAPKADDAAKPAEAGKVADPAAKVDPTAAAVKPEAGKVDPATAAAAPKPATPAPDAPSRFSTDAKAAWATAPEPVKAEVHRALRELEQGVAKYKPDAEAFVPFKEFHDLAKSLNVDPARALKEYVTLDRMLGENFPEAMARICQNKRVDIRSFAADVLGLTPEARNQLRIGVPGQQPAAQQGQPSPEVSQLQREILALKQQISGVTGHVQQQQELSRQQQEAAVNHEIEQFKATNPPLYDELSEKIASHIANDGLSLQDAYAKAYSDFQEMAQRAGLIPRQAAAPGTVDPLAAQTLLKGQKSITGAPGAGSAPASQKPSSSIREALRKAAQAA